MPDSLEKMADKPERDLHSGSGAGTSAPARLIEGEDFYVENGLLVFTAAYHLKRGSCCDSGCRHCPYSRTE